MLRIGTNIAVTRINKNPIVPIISPGLASNFSLVICRCSFIIASLEAELPVLVNTLFRPPVI